MLPLKTLPSISFAPLQLGIRRPTLSKGLRERVLRSWRRALHVVALLSRLSPQLAYRSLSIIGDSGGKSNHRDTETCQHDLIKGKLPPIPSGSRFLLDKSWTGGNKQITDRHLLKNWQVVVQIALLTKKKAGQGPLLVRQ